MTYVQIVIGKKYLQGVCECENAPLTHLTLQSVHRPGLMDIQFRRDG